MFHKGDDVIAYVDGEELDGKFVCAFTQDGTEMAEIELESPHWATGETWIDAPMDGVRVIPPAV